MEAVIEEAEGRGARFGEAERFTILSISQVKYLHPFPSWVLFFARINRTIICMCACIVLHRIAYAEAGGLFRWIYLVVIPYNNRVMDILIPSSHFSPFLFLFLIFSLCFPPLYSFFFFLVLSSFQIKSIHSLWIPGG